MLLENFAKRRYWTLVQYRADVASGTTDDRAQARPINLISARNDGLFLANSNQSFLY
jgi:hypothetical protein